MTIKLIQELMYLLIFVISSFRIGYSISGKEKNYTEAIFWLLLATLMLVLPKIYG